ncbi:MAG: cupredoxin domain-containing protein [Candidatus Aenigmarchaeota archaeon]|nr:cupredoxin domain-containing protein [Candidatus Aenigmarchaeota archaeon]
MERRNAVLLRFLVVALVVFVAGCASQPGTTTTTSIPDGESHEFTHADITGGMYVANGEDIVQKAKDSGAVWEEVRITLEEFKFNPKEIVLEAGKPYKLVFENTGKVKHEFAAVDFFRSAAFRKAEDKYGEIKAPFPTEVEVFAGEDVEIFLIPLIPGTYDLLCEIEGHREAGMSGTIKEVGKTPKSVVLADMSKGNWVQNGEELVKSAKDAKKEWKTIRIDMSDFRFDPKGITLKKGEPYKIELVNSGEEKHEFSADEFFGTAALRKVDDGSVEFKSVRLDEVEVLIGKQIDIYLIPTKIGTFGMECALPGHKEKGMSGTITVE